METPLEFAGRLGLEVPALETKAQALAGLCARSVYAREHLTPFQARAGCVWL